MTLRILAIAALTIAIASAGTATAQFRTPNQDFFDQGRDQFQREIDSLTEEGSTNSNSPLQIDRGAVQNTQDTNPSDRTPINSEDEASTTVLNTGVIRQKIRQLEQRGARVGVMVVASPTQNRSDYYLVQIQEIQPERNLTIDTFCVYRSGAVELLDNTTDRCVSLDNYQ